MDYESGKAIPNNQILSKIERALGKNRGQQSFYCYKQRSLGDPGLFALGTDMHVLNYGTTTCLTGMYGTLNA